MSYVGGLASDQSLDGRVELGHTERVSFLGLLSPAPAGLFLRHHPGPVMLIVTWNLNHRCGRTRFRPEAVKAIAALQADVVVLTEYYPKRHHSAFCANLFDAGWPYLLASSEIDGEIANRVCTPYPTVRGSRLLSNLR